MMTEQNRENNKLLWHKLVWRTELMQGGRIEFVGLKILIMKAPAILRKGNRSLTVAMRPTIRNSKARSRLLGVEIQGRASPECGFITGLIVLLLRWYSKKSPFSSDPS